MDKDFIIKYWVQILFGFITTAVGVAFKYISKLRKRSKALETGVQALLRDRIISSCNYYFDKGYCPLYARDNIDSMFAGYETLKGNGNIHELVERVKSLPFEGNK